MSAVVVPHPSSPHHGPAALHGVGVVDLPPPPGVPTVDPHHIPYLVQQMSAEAAVLLLVIASRARYDRRYGWVVDGGTDTVASWFGWGRERARTALRHLHAAGLVERGQRDQMLDNGRIVRADAYIALRPTQMGTDRHRALPPPPPPEVRSAEHAAQASQHGEPGDRTRVPKGAVHTEELPAGQVEDPGENAVEDVTWGAPLKRDMVVKTLAAWGFDGIESALDEYGEQAVSDAVKAVAWKVLTRPKSVRKAGGYARTMLRSGRIPERPLGLEESWLGSDLDLTPAFVTESSKDVLAEAQRRWEERRRYVDAVFASLTAADQARLAAKFDHLAQAFTLLDDEVRHVKETLLWEDLLATEGLLAIESSLPELA